MTDPRFNIYEKWEDADFATVEELNGFLRLIFDPNTSTAKTIVNCVKIGAGLAVLIARKNVRDQHREDVKQGYVRKMFERMKTDPFEDPDTDERRPT